MRRREFLSGAIVGAVWASAARAQQSGKIPRIGMLWVNPVEAEKKIGLVAVFHKRLAELGYVDGKTIVVEERFADGTTQRLDELAAELVRLKVDVIVSGAESAIAAAKATKLIPIVAATTSDPVAEGFAASLAHPGGNVTGSAAFFPQMMAKRLELLKRITPSVRRAGMLAARVDPFARGVFEVMNGSAKGLGVDLEIVEVPDPTTYEAAFAAASAKGIGGIVILDYATFFRDAGLIAALALKNRIPTGGAPFYARNGGLFGYAADLPELFRNAATFVDKILKGDKPGDLPFEQATKFETAVNLKTSGALGLTVPQTLLASASEVIE
jgi:putative tryptophan/tyrosine transport system substrate-binding protein